MPEYDSESIFERMWINIGRYRRYTENIINDILEGSNMPYLHRTNNSDNTHWSYEVEWTPTRIGNYESSHEKPKRWKCSFCGKYHLMDVKRKLIADYSVCPNCRKLYNEVIKLVRVYHGYSNPVKNLRDYGFYFATKQYTKSSFDYPRKRISCNVCGDKVGKGFKFQVGKYNTYSICHTCKPYLVEYIHKLRDTKLSNTIEYMIYLIREYGIDAKMRSEMNTERKLLRNGKLSKQVHRFGR